MTFKINMAHYLEKDLKVVCGSGLLEDLQLGSYKEVRRKRI